MIEAQKQEASASTFLGTNSPVAMPSETSSWDGFWRMARCLQRREQRGWTSGCRCHMPAELGGVVRAWQRSATSRFRTQTCQL